MIHFKVFVATLALFSAQVAASPSLPGPGDDPYIKDRYLVKLRPECSTDAALPMLRTVVSTAPLDTMTFTDDFTLLYMDMPADKVVAVKALPCVESITQDEVVYIDALTKQVYAPWNLGRISARSRGASDYVYDDSAGTGTVAYIVDNGIRLDHPDFEGRAYFGTNTLIGDTYESSGAHCGHHGTHVAGTVGGKTFGVAKNTTLVDVTALNCNGAGTVKALINGVLWAYHDSRRRGLIGRAVLNASWHTSYNLHMNEVFAMCQRGGMFVSVAAGNQNQDARRFSPSSAPYVCVVGASNQNFSRSDFSNFGPAVDIFAPGESIASAAHTGGWVTMDGTSMAAPHITGLAAYLIALEGTPVGKLCARMQQLASKGRILNTYGSANLLA
jgi:subtilisin family serine protease